MTFVLLRGKQDVPDRADPELQARGTSKAPPASHTQLWGCTQSLAAPTGARAPGEPWMGGDVSQNSPGRDGTQLPAHPTDTTLVYSGVRSIEGKQRQI